MVDAFVDRAWALPASCLYTCQLSACADIRVSIDPARLTGLKTSLACPDLWYEVSLLRRLVYKNSSQHRGSGLMRKLRLVTRQLAVLESLQLPDLLGDLAAMTQLAMPSTVPNSKASAASNQRTASSLLLSAQQMHRVPCQEAGLLVLHRVLGGAVLYQGLVGSCLEAAGQLAAQIAKSFFMPLCITATAMLARIQALAMQQLQSCVATYNTLVQLQPFLPTAHPSTQTPVAAPSAPAAAAPTLPGTLDLVFKCNLPCVVGDQAQPVSLAAAGAGSSIPQWLSQHAQQVWEDMGLMTGLQASYVGPSQRQLREGSAVVTDAHIAVDASSRQQRGSALGARPAGGVPQEAAGVSNKDTQPPRTAANLPVSERQQQLTQQAGRGGAGAAAQKGVRRSQALPPVPTAPTRQSFFDMISKGKQPPAAKARVNQPASAAQPSQATAHTTLVAAASTGVFVDRGGRHSTLADTASAVPVYTTTVLPGFGLGLGLGAAEQLPAPVQQQQQAHGCEQQGDGAEQQEMSDTGGQGPGPTVEVGQSAGEVQGLPVVVGRARVSGDDAVGTVLNAKSRAVEVPVEAQGPEGQEQQRQDRQQQKQQRVQLQHASSNFANASTAGTVVAKPQSRPAFLVAGRAPAHSASGYTSREEAPSRLAAQQLSTPTAAGSSEQVAGQLAMAAAAPAAGVAGSTPAPVLLGTSRRAQKKAKALAAGGRPAAPAAAVAGSDPPGNRSSSWEELLAGPGGVAGAENAQTVEGASKVQAAGAKRNAGGMGAEALEPTAKRGKAEDVFQMLLGK